MTYRLLKVLLDGLPGDSAFKTAVRDRLDDDQLSALAKQPMDGHGPWSHEALRLAAIEDQLRLLRREFATANGAKPDGEFEPVPRPGVRRSLRRAANAAAAAYIRSLAQQHAELHGYASKAG